MSVLVLPCGNVFDGVSDAPTGPAEIHVEGNRARLSRYYRLVKTIAPTPIAAARLPPTGDLREE